MNIARITGYLGIALFAASLHAGDAPRTTAASLQSERLNDKVSLDVKDLDLASVFTLIGKATAIQFEVAPGLKDRVSLDVKELPARGVLELLETSQGLVYRQDGERVLVEKAIAPTKPK